MHRRRQFRQHPNEPWLWERAWRRELRPLVRWKDYLGPLLVILFLVARPGLPPVNTVTVRLLRMRERDETIGSGNKSRVKVHRTIEYKREHSVDATCLREGRDLPLPLEWPDVGADNSTVWRGSLCCFWDLQLSFDGSDLSSTYRLPIYYTVGENPEGR